MEDRYYIDRRIHELLGQNKKPKTIAQQLGCSEQRVYYQKEKFDQGLDWHDRSRAGAPPKLKEEDIAKVKKILKRKAVQTPARAAKVMRTEMDVDVSGSTVRRAIKKAGMRYRIKPIKPKVTEADKSARVRFAKRRRPKGFWKRVWWTDEKAFLIHNEPRGIWVEVRDKVPVRQKGLVPDSVRVWAGISHYGKTDLYIIPSFWNADQYKTHLETNALPDIRSKSPEGFIFEQDGDGAHTGKKVQKLLEDEEVELLDDFTARSPDIPPIENMWKLTMDGMKYRNSKTKAGFIKALKEEWKKISLEKVRKLTDSIPNRLKEVIRLDGAPIKY